MKVENLCICYASNYHLGIIIGEYLKKNSAKENSIITYFEEGIENEINTLIKNYKMEQLLNLNFEKTIINNIINDEIKNNDTIILKGSTNYIKKIKELINKKTENMEGKIRIITCIDFENQINEEMKYCNFIITK